MTFILREPTCTFGTAEAAERIGVETQFLSVRLSDRRLWRRFFDIDHPGSGGRINLTARDVVVLAALRDMTAPSRGNHAIVGDPLRSQFVDLIRTVTWGTTNVQAGHNGFHVDYDPHWLLAY